MLEARSYTGVYAALEGARRERLRRSSIVVFLKSSVVYAGASLKQAGAAEVWYSRGSAA